MRRPYVVRVLDFGNEADVMEFAEFDDAGRMKDSPLYRRVVDVCEELVKFTWLMRGRADYLTSRYSERVESAEQTSRRVNQGGH